MSMRTGPLAYVNSIDYNGQHYGADSATLYSNGTEHFTVG